MTQTHHLNNYILIVEDDADMRETLGDLFQLEGYRVAHAANGREALDHLRRCELPCIILLDLMMPVMNGWEFRTEQRQDPQLAQIPVAVITGVRSNGSQVTSLDAVGYFQKPLDFDALLTTVTSYCSLLGSD